MRRSESSKPAGMEMLLMTSRSPSRTLIPRSAAAARPFSRPGLSLLGLMAILVFPSVGRGQPVITEFADLTSIATPGELVVDATGNLFLAGFTGNGKILKFTPAGVMSTVLDVSPEGLHSELAMGPGGNLFVINSTNGTLLEVSQAGVASVILDSSGDGVNSWGGNGDIATDAAGNVFVTDRSGIKVFKITAAGAVSLVLDGTAAGSGGVPPATYRDVATDSLGNVFVTTGPTNDVRKLTPNGTKSTILDATGDGTGSLGNARAVATDSLGNVFVTGQQSRNLFKVTPQGAITEFFDSAAFGISTALHVVATDPAGNVFVGKRGQLSREMFRITSAGVASVMIDRTGDGTSAFVGHLGIAADSAGNVYVSGSQSNNIFKITYPSLAVCGDGTVEGTEECDDGACCTASCTLAAVATECRGSAGVCDVAEACDGVSAACPVDEFAPATTECRSSSAICDAAEYCDGAGAECAEDGVEPIGTPCRLSIDPECDAEEVCDGVATSCPADLQEPDGQTCDDSAAETVGETCSSGLCGCLGPDLDGDLIANVCDPLDAIISSVRKVVGKPKRSKGGSLKATRGTIQTSAPLDVSEGITIAFSDGLTMMETATLTAKDCLVSSKGKVICRAGKGAAAKFTPTKNAGEYLFNVKLRDLGYEAPVAGPITMVITEEATSIDHAITLTSCTVRTSTIKCQ